jgi:hypothetical protein
MEQNGRDALLRPLSFHHFLAASPRKWHESNRQPQRQSCAYPLSPVLPRGLCKEHPNKAKDRRIRRNQASPRLRHRRDPQYSRQILSQNLLLGFFRDVRACDFRLLHIRVEQRKVTAKNNALRAEFPGRQFNLAIASYRGAGFQEHIGTGFDQLDALQPIIESGAQAGPQVGQQNRGLRNPLGGAHTGTGGRREPGPVL